MYVCSTTNLTKKKEREKRRGVSEKMQPPQRTKCEKTSDACKYPTCMVQGGEGGEANTKHCGAAVSRRRRRDSLSVVLLPIFLGGPKGVVDVSVKKECFEGCPRVPMRYHKTTEVL